MAPGGSIGEVACPSHRLHPLGDTVSVHGGDVDLHQRMRHSWCAIAPAAVPAANAMHLAPLRNAFTRGTSPLPSMRHWVILGSRHAWVPSFLSAYQCTVWGVGRRSGDGARWLSLAPRIRAATPLHHISRRSISSSL